MKEIWNLEQLYDQNNRTELESLLLAKSDFIQIASQILIDLLDNNLKSALEIIKLSWNPKLFSLNESVFLLQFAIAINETFYDLSERKKWFLKWGELGDFRKSKYAEHLYNFQKGIELFYQRAYALSNRHWEISYQLATEINYVRGQYRLLFHFFMYLKETGSFDYANDKLLECEKISLEFGAIRFQERIREQKILLVNSNKFVNTMQTEVTNLLMVNKKRAARKLCLYYCKVRRVENRSWQASSEYSLIAMIALSFGKDRLFSKIIERIDDQIVKYSILKFGYEYKKSRNEIFNQFEQLEMINHFEKINEPLKTPNLLEVKKFINLLKAESDGISKSKICKFLWNYDYDPVVHDNRIYKLITKARKYLGSKTSIINCYGELYKLNSI